MDHIMEPDELKAAWQTLGRRIEHSDTLTRQLLRERRLDRVRGNLRWMYAGKIAQILFGDALIYFGITTGLKHLATPHLLACSVFMLAYGVLTLVLAGLTLSRISNIDYAAPVLDIQRRALGLVRLQTLANRWLGLPWWFLWIAIFALEMKANLGVDLFTTAPAFLWASAAVGAVGLVASLAYLRRRDARLGEGHDAPRRLRDARRTLEELQAFERE
ncbi:hypothetical protein [Pseudoxanthomonas sp. X-1]|uniref:hypothetical protein n=1 Tax=Pseudoxanthomonas sp. X-1 TaxID=2571115 RepID=UPI00110B80B6|nr:hypothetical protein [Pseudoxanthomonas sp. X-1]TMN24958.1 hypothetical protein FF950_04145 [Pseudoxanthomonas sp. X-1]UAY73736.1 hypothetical protein LAJ50_14790 [Pseudoxanthomonas sp. X-1]